MGRQADERPSPAPSRYLAWLDGRWGWLDFPRAVSKKVTDATH